MRRGVIFCAILLLSDGVFPQETKPTDPLPDQFEIGIYSFSDVGPTENYDVLAVKGKGGQDASVEEVNLTPAHACVLPAKLEVASGFSQSIPELLGGLNPCSIPQEELHQKLKPNGRLPSLSYSMVAMRVQCGGQTRVIRSDILDRDIKYVPPSWAPNRTWTGQLLLDLSAVVPGAAKKNVPIGPDQSQFSQGTIDSPELRELRTGGYDALFPNAPGKLSELYRAAQEPLPQPTVHLVSSQPVAPDIVVLPVYPRLSRLTGAQGLVSFRFDVNAVGKATNLTFGDTDYWLRQAVENAVNRWNFPDTAAGHQVHATIEFETNCPR